MRQSIFFEITCIAILALNSSVALGDKLAPWKPDRHQWQRITYPLIRVAKIDRQTFFVIVGSGQRDEKQQLRLDVLLSGPLEGGRPRLLGDEDKIIVRLHMPDGKVVEANPDSGRGKGGFGHPQALTWSLTYMFPWGRNLLEEAWFELRTTGTT